MVERSGLIDSLICDLRNISTASYTYRVVEAVEAGEVDQSEELSEAEEVSYNSWVGVSRQKLEVSEERS